MSKFTLHLIKKFADTCKTRNKEEFKKQFAVFSIAILRTMSVSETDQRLFLIDLDKNFNRYYNKLNKTND